MYGDPDADTFDEVHANTNSSSIKNNIDTWYKTNIVDKGYGNYISNTVGFCGDRTLYSENGINITQNSYFGTYGRYVQNTAQFTCPNIERDLYTTTDSSIGNKALTYPVGLITYDELIFAGMDGNHINKLSWIYSVQNYWTMSPSNFSATNKLSIEWGVSNNGYINHWWNVGDGVGVRTVINLKPDVKITGGTGTANDPFIVDTNN